MMNKQKALVGFWANYRTQKWMRFTFAFIVTTLILAGILLFSFGVVYGVSLLVGLSLTFKDNLLLAFVFIFGLIPMIGGQINAGAIKR